MASASAVKGQLTSIVLSNLGSPCLLGLSEPLFPLVDLLAGGVGVKLGLERLAVEDAVEDARDESRVPYDL